MAGWGPLPTGPGATQMVKDLRAMNAQIYGTLFASAGVISGDVTIEGTFIGNDYLSSNWDGAIPVNLSTVDATATAGFAWDASLGSAQLMGDLWVGGDIIVGDVTGIHTVLAGDRGIIDFRDDNDGDIYAPISYPALLPGLVEENPPSGTERRYDFYMFGADFSLGTHPWIRLTSENVANDNFVMIGVGALANGSFIATVDGVDIGLTPGSTTWPSLAFHADLNTGLMQSNADEISHVLGGNERWIMGASYFTAANVTGAARIDTAVASKSKPSYGFQGDNNLGMMRVQADILGFVAATQTWVQVKSAGENQGAISRNDGAILVDTTSKTLDSGSGSIIAGQSWAWSVGNQVALELQAIRDPTGTDWTTAAVGFRRITDNTAQASLWWKGSQIIVNQTTSQYGDTLAVSGSIEAKPDTTGAGSSATWTGGASGWWELRHNTSARRYKRKISYEWQDYLADMTLLPAYFYRPDDDRWYFDFIAEDLAEQESIFGVYDDDGVIDNYHKPAVLAILAAKVNRLEAQVKELQNGIH